MAVFQTESSKYGKLLNFGPIDSKGRFIGPGGIFKKCKEDKVWQQDILDPFFNAKVAILAMTRWKDFNKSMRKYNATCNSAYLNRIRELEGINEESGLFDNLELVKMIYKYDIK
jgi:hypothetical protein